jgi:hypothetical protein
MGARVLSIAAIWSVLLAGATAQSALPKGTILPIQLEQSLSFRKVHAGQEFHASLMQDIPGSTVRRRARLVGHIITVTGLGRGAAQIAIRFEEIEEHGRRIPITASLRALASWSEVQQAQMPEESMDRGITPETATTTQIGGEQVYRGGGPVSAGVEAVGTPVPYGVLARPRPNRGLGCGGVVGDDRPQALWLFSTDACGVYGLPQLKIVHAGRSDPVGTIVLKADSAKLKLPVGSGLLLRVQ